MKLLTIILMMLLISSASAQYFEEPIYLRDELGNKIINPEIDVNNRKVATNLEGTLFTENGLTTILSTSSESSPLTSGVVSFSQKGYDANQPYAGNLDVGTINLYSGTLTRTDIDYSAKGRGMDFAVQRTYNSNIFKSIKPTTDSALPMIDSIAPESAPDARLNKPGPLGHGWSGWHYGRILSPMYFVCGMNYQVNEWTWEKPDGSQAVFIKDKDNQNPGEWRLSDGSRVEFINPYENYPQGTQRDDTGVELIVITTPDGTKYVFSHHVYPTVGYINPELVNNFGNVQEGTDGIALLSGAVSCVANDPRSADAEWYGPTNPQNKKGSVENKYTDLFYGTGQDFPTVTGEEYFVDNHLAGIYLTRIEDVNGNYITFSYDEEISRGFEQYTGDYVNDVWIQYNGNLLGYTISWGSPYVKEVEDTIGRKVEYEYQKLSNTQDWQKRIKEIKYYTKDYEEQKIKYTYGPPNTEAGNYVDCINRDPYINPSNQLGICVQDGFLTKVEVQDSQGNNLMPPTNYYYDKNTGELIKVEFSTGGSVEYVYISQEEYFYDIGGSSLPSGNYPTTRRVVHKTTIDEGPTREPLQTYYFYVGPSANNVDDDDLHRKTYVVHPVSKEKQFDESGNPIIVNGEQVTNYVYAIEEVNYLSPNPKKVFSQVLNHLQGLELDRIVYEKNLGTNPNLPIQYMPEVLNEQGKEITAYNYLSDNPQVIQQQTTPLSQVDMITKTKYHYTASSLGYHSFYTRHLNGFFGNEYLSLYSAKTPHDISKYYTARIQGIKTTYYEGGQRTTYTKSEYDQFGNTKVTEEFGVVTSANKGASDSLATDGSCDGWAINRLDSNNNPACIFSGQVTVIDDTSFGPQEYKRTEIRYAHEQQSANMPNYGTWYLGKDRPEQRYCVYNELIGLDECDPLSDYRNVLFQRLNLPTEIIEYDKQGNVMRKTKNYYDEKNPELASYFMDNYDSRGLANHRSPQYQHGIDLSNDVCILRRGMLTSTEIEYYENGVLKKYKPAITTYDTTGNVRKVTFPNQNSIYNGYDSPANEPLILSNICGSLLKDGERVENNKIILKQENIFFDEYGNPIITGDSQINLKDNAKAFPTTTKIGVFEKNTEYDYNTGLIIEETLTNGQTSRTNTYNYDKLGRIIETYESGEKTPSTIVNYVDFPTLGMPQEVQVRSKLEEPEILLVYINNGDRSYQNLVNMIENQGIEVNKYEVDAADFLANTRTYVMGMENLNLFDRQNTLLWVGPHFDYYLEEINQIHSQENAPVSYGKFVIEGGSTIVFSKYIPMELYTQSANLQISSQSVYGEQISWWEDTNKPFPQSTSTQEFHLYEDTNAPINSPIYPFTIPAGRFASSRWEGTITPTVFLSNNEFNYIMQQQRNSATYSWGIASDDGKLQIMSLLPSLIDPELGKEYLNKIMNNEDTGKYSNTRRNFYDGLGRNFVSVQKDTDNKYIVLYKELDDTDQSVRREFKPFKVDSFYYQTEQDCLSAMPNAVECYLKNNIELGINQPGIEYFKDGLKRVNRIRNHGHDLGTTGIDKDITTKFMSGTGVSINSDKEGKVLRTYTDGAGNSIKEEMLANNEVVKLVERQYNNLGLLESTTVKDYNNQNNDRIIRYTYDTKGRLLGVRTPDSGVSTFTYDNMDNKIRSANALGEEVKNTEYDEYNRIKKTAITGYPGYIEYFYDDTGNGIGNLKQINDFSGITKYTYDNKGRLKTLSQELTLCDKYNVNQELCDPIILTFEYFADGGIKSISDGEKKIIYYRDDLGRVDRVIYFNGQENVEVLKSSKFTASGAINELTLGNNVIEQYDYYDREINLLKSHKIISPSGVLYERGYKYTPSLNLESEYSSTTMDSQSRLASYEYDEMNQLLAVNDLGLYGNSYFYQYDKLGNILEVETIKDNSQNNLLEDVYNYYQGTSRLESTRDYTYIYDAAGRAIMQLGNWIIPNNDWNYNLGSGSATHNLNSLTITGQNAYATLSNDMPVIYGQKYIVYATINYDITSGYGFFGTRCKSQGEYLTSSCNLENINPENRVQGQGSKQISFEVVAESTDALDLEISLICGLGAIQTPSTGTISCSNVQIRQAHQSFTYDANNMIKTVQIEGGECINYHYDYLSKRILEADASTNKITRYFYNGEQLHAKLEAAGSVSCPTETQWENYQASIMTVTEESENLDEDIVSETVDTNITQETNTTNTTNPTNNETINTSKEVIITEPAKPTPSRPSRNVAIR